MQLGATTRGGYNNGISVNSRLYVSFSDTAMIQVGAWNSQISIRVHPCRGLDPDGRRIYEQEKSRIVITSLTMENVAALVDGVKKKIKPAYDEGKEASVTVTMGSDANKKAITLFTDGKKMFFKITLNLDDSDKTNSEENILVHEFRTREYISNYDPITGEGERTEVPVDFINFMKALEDVYVLQPAISHSITYHTEAKSAFTNTASNFGGGFGSFGGNAGGGFQSRQFGGSGNSGGGESSIMPLATTSSTDSFSSFMESK